MFFNEVHHSEEFAERSDYQPLWIFWQHVNQMLPNFHVVGRLESMHQSGCKYLKPPNSIPTAQECSLEAFRCE